MWQSIETAPKEPIRTSPKSPWFAGEKHGPVIQLKFSQIEDGKDLFEKWSTQIGWWQPRKLPEDHEVPAGMETGCWRFLEDVGAYDCQPAFWAPLLDRNPSPIFSVRGKRTLWNILTTELNNLRMQDSEIQDEEIVAKLAWDIPYLEMLIRKINEIPMKVTS